jgi:hypothetical protein
VQRLTTPPCCLQGASSQAGPDLSTQLKALEEQNTKLQQKARTPPQPSFCGFLVSVRERHVAVGASFALLRPCRRNASVHFCLSATALGEAVMQEQPVSDGSPHVATSYDGSITAFAAPAPPSTLQRMSEYAPLSLDSMHTVLIR